MLTPPFSFDDVLAPLGAERFFAAYEGRRPLHLKGAADKFAAVMSWSRLNDLLGMATIWSQASLQLVLENELIPPARYCAPAAGLGGGQVLRPDPDQVKRFLQQGATLVANDIDHLSAGLTAFAHALEQALGGKVQGNLYLSSRRRPGFAAHFDTHDVYAVHVEGTKTWHVYEGRAVDPIAHPSFRSFSREHHEKARGAKLMDVHMAPGDLLYLPRGQYHDALADEGGAVHVAFGITYPIGMDVMAMLYERVVALPEFRANLPRPDGPGGARALAAALEALAQRITGVLTDPETAQKIVALQKGFHYPRHHYDLPDLLRTAADERYRVRAQGIRLVQQGGRFGLVREGSRAATEVPGDVSGMVGWVMERPAFSVGELSAAFPERSAGQIEKLLRDLATMRLVEVL
ncbi:MAG TPA: cupin domain-containing protein [Geminicoccaceae bacterium]|nr:cupin domain-containing protein [Geminicoccaceae bacterium]